MKKTVQILIGLMLITSCGKEIANVEFSIKATSYVLENGSTYSSDTIFDFTHTLSGGTVTFSSGDEVFVFRTGTVSIENYTFVLPEGEYLMEFNIPYASLYGQAGGAFTATPSTITISETMESDVTVDVVPNSALLLVRDVDDQLNYGVSMIRRYASEEGFFLAYSLFPDTVNDLRYTYITPDTLTTNPSAYLWFYSRRSGKESGGLSTINFEIGYQYLIEVFD
ncbi:hypothetical protein ACFLT1_08630 [Bacteroidota bacterium]